MKTLEIKRVNYDGSINNIGVISDTHIPSRGRFIPAEVFRAFNGVQLILHAGDLVEERVLEELQVLAPVEAVAGNMDPPRFQKGLGKAKVIKIGAVSIGLVHGDLIGRRADPEQLAALFRPQKLQAIVFGHLHEPVSLWHHGTLFFNPGSATDPRRGSKAACGRLDICDTAIREEIIYF